MNITAPNAITNYVGSGQLTVPRPYCYGVGACFGILILLIIFTYAHYIHRRCHPDTNNHNHLRHAKSPDHQGLDETILQAFPKLLYSEVKNDNKGAALGTCSICLQEYEESDLLRSLPECGHHFHLNCVDPWLMLQSTCPICRNSPSILQMEATPARHVIGD